MFEYFYNEIFRSVIIGFGSLFNGIEVKTINSSIGELRNILSPNFNEVSLQEFGSKNTIIIRSNT